MTDANEAASQEPAATTDLDSILNTAIETHTPQEDAPVAEAAAEAAPEPVVDDAGRLRGPDGKFVAKETDSAAKAPDKGTAEAATTEPVVAAIEPAPVVQPLEAPARWTAERKAEFATWPRNVQETVLERNKELEADYTRKTQETAELRRSAEPVLNAIAPYQPYLNQLAPKIGLTPDKMIGQLLGTEYQLRTGDPHEKVAALYQIAQSYGIDLAAISRGEMPAAPDPAFSQLRQELVSLKDWKAQFEQQREAEQQQQTVSQIQAFAASTDEAGRPKYPHFERVRGVMGQLMSSDSSLDLQTAYAKAVEPINAAVAEELRLRTETAEKQRLETVEKAKKAAPVKTSGSSAPNGSTKSKGLDDILSASIDRHFQ